LPVTFLTNFPIWSKEILQSAIAAPSVKEA